MTIFFDELFLDRKGKNITGFVSSLNKNCTQWYSQIVMQSSKQEISDGLARCMAEALFQYKRRQEQLPQVRGNILKSKIGYRRKGNRFGKS